MKTLEKINETKDININIANVRLDIPIPILKDLISDIKKMEDNYLKKQLLKIIDNGKIIKYSAKKGLAAEKATAARTKKVKVKIQNSIDILKLENKKITYYTIAKHSKVAFNTVKKYVNL